MISSRRPWPQHGAPHQDSPERDHQVCQATPSHQQDTEDGQQRPQGPLYQEGDGVWDPEEWEESTEKPPANKRQELQTITPGNILQLPGMMERYKPKQEQLVEG